MFRVLLLTGAAAEWHEMPDGLYYHEDCIHRFDQDFHVNHGTDGGSTVTFANGLTSLSLPPCEHRPRAAPELMVGSNTSTTYYSDWSVYAKASRSQGFGYMSSKWEVPAKPTKRGPASTSSVYLFNGLEDGGGHKGESSLILQPVLQFGKSGCIINPLNWGKWWLTSYMVDGDGRAYCGSRLGPLKEGEQVIGEMTLTNQTDNTWRVDATRVSTGDVSTHSASLGDVIIDAAYATMEGMIIYNCQSYPNSGSCSFTENKLSDRSGQPLSNIRWEKVQQHTECAQDVHMPSSDADPITLVWDPTITNDAVMA